MEIKIFNKKSSLSVQKFKMCIFKVGISRSVIRHVRTNGITDVKYANEN